MTAPWEDEAKITVEVGSSSFVFYRLRALLVPEAGLRRRDWAPTLGRFVS